MKALLFMYQLISSYAVLGWFVVAPIRMRHGRAIFLRNIALAGVLLAFAIGGFATDPAISNERCG